MSRERAKRTGEERGPNTAIPDSPGGQTPDTETPGPSQMRRCRQARPQGAWWEGEAQGDVCVLVRGPAVEMSLYECAEAGCGVS